MKRGRDGGYTIVEVMIVLAVTGALFASVVVLLAGKQNKTQFQQGVNGFESSVQSVMSNVLSGYYGNGFSCVASDAIDQPALTPLSAVAPGSNAGCIFLGKAMYQVAPADVKVIDVVGRQYVRNSPRQEATSIDTAFPTFDPSADSHMVSDFKMNYGVELVKIKNLAPAGGTLNGIAFYNDLGGETSNSSGVNRQAVHLYGLVGANPTDAVTLTSASNYIALPDGVVMCLSDGRQTAEITIGTNGSDNNISSTINTGVGKCA